jgi:hypothetical protein
MEKVQKTSDAYRGADSHYDGYVDFFKNATSASQVKGASNCEDDRLKPNKRLK